MAQNGAVGTVNFEDEDSDEGGVPESHIDSITLSNVMLPGGLILPKCPIAADDTIQEVIQRVFNECQLDNAHQQYTFVVADADGKFHWLNSQRAVCHPDVIDLLASHITISIRPIEDMPGEGSLAFGNMGVNMKI